MRWDEWITFSSPRIAPFRTRTLHVPQHFHTLPAPNAQTVSTVRTILPDMLSFSHETGTSRVPGRAVMGRENGDGDGDGIKGGIRTETREKEHMKESSKMRESDGGPERDQNREEQPSSERIEDSTVQQDSIISLLPTVSRMLQTLQPQLEAAARIAAEVSTHLSHKDAPTLRHKYFVMILESFMSLF